jgi:hypothetical protein
MRNAELDPIGEKKTWTRKTQCEKVEYGLLFFKRSITHPHSLYFFRLSERYFAE